MNQWRRFLAPIMSSCFALSCVARSGSRTELRGDTTAPVTRESVVQECRARENTAPRVGEAERDALLTVIPSQASDFQYSRADSLRAIETDLLALFLSARGPVWKLSMNGGTDQAEEVLLCRRRTGGDDIDVFRLGRQDIRGRMGSQPWSGLTLFVTRAQWVSRDSISVIASPSISREAIDSIFETAVQLSLVLNVSPRPAPAWIFVFADSTEMISVLPYMTRAQAATLFGLGQRPTIAWAQHDLRDEVAHELVHVVTAPWVIDGLQSGVIRDSRVEEGLAEGMSGATAVRIAELGGGRDSAALRRGIGLVRRRAMEQGAPTGAREADRSDPTWSDWLGMHYVALAAACRPFPRWVLRPEMRQDPGAIVRATAAALALPASLSQPALNEAIENQVVTALTSQLQDGWTRVSKAISDGRRLVSTCRDAGR